MQWDALSASAAAPPLPPQTRKVDSELLLPQQRGIYAMFGGSEVVV